MSGGGIDERDQGPWVATKWRGEMVVLQSDDFHHDVALVVTGDFKDFDSKMRYAEWLAGILTSACNPEEIQTFNHERDCGLTNDAGKCECSTDSGEVNG